VKVDVHLMTCTQMFLAVLFVVPKIRNKCQPIDEWVNNSLSMQCNTSWQWKGKSINTYNNMDEYQKYCAEWERPQTKEFILNDCISVKF